MSRPENPRAFPSAAIDPEFGGMMLRDWFAGQAMLGIISAHKSVVLSSSNAADHAYNFADAMLAERDKGGAK